MTRSKDELDALANADPEIDAANLRVLPLLFLATFHPRSLYRLVSAIYQMIRLGKLPIPKLDLSSIPDAVAQMRTRAVFWPTPPPISEVTESKRKYTTRDGTELDLFVFQSTNATQTPKPLVILYHGGGGVIGNAYSVAPLAREIVLSHECVVISPQYRFAPEHAFPTGPNDGWDAFEYISTNASRFSADPSVGLVVGGESNGAVITSLIALRARETSHTPQITGLYFAAPAFISTPETIPEKYRDQYRSQRDKRCVNAPVLDASTRRFFDKAYDPDITSPLYRALNVQPLSKHARVAPKAYFQICGMDILRDDGLIYEQILRESGVVTKIDVYEGMPHIFWNVFTWVKKTARWKKETRWGVGWLLDREREGK